MSSLDYVFITTSREAPTSRSLQKVGELHSYIQIARHRQDIAPPRCRVFLLRREPIHKALPRWPRQMPGRTRYSMNWHQISHSQGLVEVLVYLHDRCLVTASIAIIRCAEYGHHVHPVRPVVSLQDKRVATYHRASRSDRMQHNNDSVHAHKRRVGNRTAENCYNIMSQKK